MARMGGRAPAGTRLVPVALLLALVVACGGEGGEGAASSPTRTPTADRSVDRPSDRPTAERTEDRPGPDETDDATPEEPTPDVPAPTRDRPERPEDAASERVPANQQPSPTSTTDDADPTVAADSADGEGETVPPWVWWLLVALLLGVAVAVPLIVRGRRHAAWRGELAEAEGEIAWFARELLQGLRHARSREEVSGGWTVGQPRVVAAEDHLTVLESSAPDEVGRYRARELLDASRQARGQLDTLTGPGPQETWMLDLDAIMDDLEHVLVGRGRNPSSELPE
jgi:hypothetical protein